MSISKFLNVKRGTWPTNIDAGHQVSSHQPSLFFGQQHTAAIISIMPVTCIGNAESLGQSCCIALLAAARRVAAWAPPAKSGMSGYGQHI